MSDIVDKMLQEVIKRSDEFEKQTKGTKEEYNIYREHIRYVYKYVLLLSNNKSVDREVVALSALLHDISMTDRTLDRSRHNEFSAVIAEELLRDNGYPEEKIQMVVKCILNHSSKRANFRTTLEEEILVWADGLSHFDSFMDLYSLAYNVMGLSEEESVKYVIDKLTRDYQELGSDIRYLIDDKYKKILSAKNKKELFDVAYLK